MSFKIAFRNVKKSFKDYGIYFLTLTLAVCIFYTFNSMGSQQALVELKNSGNMFVGSFNQLMSYISVFVVIILASLILYANKFLIRRRNKEFGIYMILGMGKFKISRILILETIIVGFVSLISGILIGIFLSQGLSFLVLNLFEVDFNQYQFTISTLSMIKTSIYFGIMFLFVIIFNSYMISKYKVIDLINTSKKCEKIKIKSKFIHLILFLISLFCLIRAYLLILEIGLKPNQFEFFISCALGVVGTILFFYSLCGFILYLVSKNKKIYFKNLNIFVIKQISSKINTNFLSMSIICLMLFVTIGVLSTGIGFKNILENDVKRLYSFDGEAGMYLPDNGLTIEKSFDKLGFNFKDGDKFAYFEEYFTEMQIYEILNMGEDEGKEYELNYDFSYMKISDYNKIRDVNNEEEIKLSDNEVLILSRDQKIIDIFKNYLEDNSKIKINGLDYNLNKENIIVANSPISYFVVVVSDEFLGDDAKIKSSNVVVNFNEYNKDESDKNFRELLQIYKEGNLDYEEFGFVRGSSKKQFYEEVMGLTIIILFIAIYLGIIFLISSTAVLTIQQLSEASESIHRYKSLKKLGVSNKKIDKTIFTQVLIYFSAPISLAIVHSIVGIKVLSDFGKNFNQNIFLPSLIVMTIILIVYLLYFYVTYTTYKNVVKNEI